MALYYHEQRRAQCEWRGGSGARIRLGFHLGFINQLVELDKVTFQLFGLPPVVHVGHIQVRRGLRAVVVRRGGLWTAVCGGITPPQHVKVPLANGSNLT